jgi:hypothetical protein
MTTAPVRGRVLADLLTELVNGMLDATPRHAGLRPTRIELVLPVETRVAASGPDGLVVHADVPATRTRTPFDLPIGRLAVTLAGEAGR